jgi:hypothetical protein
MKTILTLGIALALTSAALGSSVAEARGRMFVREEWNRGRWVHDRHSGRLGWWWVVGPSWTFYERPHSFVIAQPAPVVIQQAPPVVVQQAPVPPPPPPAPAPVMYYCKATGTHYPETMTCPGGWMTMTAETPPVPAGSAPPPPTQ